MFFPLGLLIAGCPIRHLPKAVSQGCPALGEDFPHTPLHGRFKQTPLAAQQTWPVLVSWGGGQERGTLQSGPAALPSSLGGICPCMDQAGGRGDKRELGSLPCHQSRRKLFYLISGGRIVSQTPVLLCAVLRCILAEYMT